MSNRLANYHNISSLLSPESIFQKMDQLFNFDSGINYQGNIIEVSVPGYTDKDITIQLHEGIVTVKGERKLKNSSSSIYKSFTVPFNCNPEKVEAKLEHGMLTLTFESLKKSEVKEIPINN